MLPTGWSFVARAPVEGRAGFESYSVADGADGRTRITIAVGPYGVPATPETLAKVVDTMLDVSLDRIRRLKSLGEAHEVERAATEIQGMAAGFAIVEIASPPLFDGPPDILRGATFIAVDGERCFACSMVCGDARWPAAWPAFKQLVNSLRLARRE